MSEISPLFVLDAEEMIKNHKYSEAIELCLKGLDAYPDYAMGYKLLIRAYSENDEFDKALDYTHQAQKSFPGDTFFKKIEQNINIKLQSDSSDKEEANDTQKSELAEEETNSENTDESPRGDNITREANEDDSMEQELEKVEATPENKEDNEDTPEDAGGSDEAKNEEMKIEEEIVLENNEKDNDEEAEDNDNIDTNIGDSDLEDTLKDEDATTINYEYTEPQSLNSNNPALIPGFNMNALEASNIDARLKIIQLSKFQKEQIRKEPVITDKYAKIANDLKTSKPDFNNINENKNIHLDKSEKSVISDTLAFIYYQQGALEQALDAYRKLYNQNPDAKYQEIIEEIEEKLNYK